MTNNAITIEVYWQKHDCYIDFDIESVSNLTYGSVLSIIYLTNWVRKSK